MHLNEHTVVLITFGKTMPQKSNASLIDAVFNDVTAHRVQYPSQGMDLLLANMKHHAQLHLLITACVLNAAMAMIVSIDANDWNDSTWEVGQFSGSGSHHILKIHGRKAPTELYISMHFVLP